MTWFEVALSCVKSGALMNGRFAEDSQAIDGKTSRSICNAVGERLQQRLRPDFSRLPDRLRELMEALRRREAQAERRPR